MANKNNKGWHDKYYKALVALGAKVTENQKLNTYRKIWKKLDQEYKARGEKRPTLAEAQKIYKEINLENDNITLTEAMSDYLNEHRDEYMHTAPSHEDLDEIKAEETIDLFEYTIERIYQDTLTYIDDNKAGRGHEGGKLASIASDHLNEIFDSYQKVKEKLEQLKQEYPLSILAQAIQDNVELDYAITIGLRPPSDLEIYFDITLEQLIAVQSQIDARASELAEQAEREYWGK